jgi:hypothetical protein
MSDLNTCFRFHRQCGKSPKVALASARQDVASGKHRYPRDIAVCGKAFSAFGETAMRWIENAESMMRKVGFADKICTSIDHRGWYADDDCDQIIRGVVYQLPTRGGKLQFAYGYADPINDGAACLSCDLTDDKDSAARWADAIAERVAEAERDYQAAWRAGRAFDDLGDSVKTMRAECLDLIGEAKALRSALCATVAVKQTIIGRIGAYVADIAKARAERARLAANFGAQPGFAE